MRFMLGIQMKPCLRGLQKKHQMTTSPFGHPIEKEIAFESDRDTMTRYM